MRTPVSSSPSSLYNCTSSFAATPSPPSVSSVSISCSRCEGLDLLAMAALEVAGGNRGMESNTNGKNNGNEEQVMVAKGEVGGDKGAELGARPKRRQMVTPSKFQDSILQPWKRRTRRRRLSSPAK